MPGEQTSEQAAASKPTKILPTERVAFEKQLDILRAFAAASANGSKYTTLEEASAIVKMAKNTVYLANPFFCSIGFLTKTDTGYMPSPEVLNFFRAYEWNRDTASHKLAPVIQSSWFFQKLQPKLSYDPMPVEKAVSELAEASSAGPTYRKALLLLVEYTVSAGLIQRDGDILRLVRNGQPMVNEPIQPQRIEVIKPIENVPETISRSRIVTAFAQSTEGAVHFNVSVRVDMAEFAGWQPERISAFFGGIAQVLAAKAKIEKEVGE